MEVAHFRQIVGQAIQLIDQVYVHLPLKQAMHAVAPGQRLRLLRDRLDAIREPDFHREMVSIFKQLRDLHTIYILPTAFQNRTAVLPFEIEEYYDGDDRRYAVTQIRPGVETATFKVGVEITHWNGTPVRRAIEANAAREAGSNPEAQFAQGLAALTQRHLAVSLPPDEDWVVVTYRSGSRSRSRDARFEWNIISPPPLAGTTAPTLLGGGDDVAAPLEPDAARTALGIDVRAELERRVRKLLFEPESVKFDAEVKKSGKAKLTAAAAAAAGAPDLTKVSHLPDVFSFRTVKTKSGTFGYVRIYTFMVEWPATVDDFLNEFERIVRLLPQDGLILDVRGNGGGVIAAGERLLQLLTPHTIDPERFSFIASPLTGQICGRWPQYYGRWHPSLTRAQSVAAGFSDGFPLLPPDDYNDRGQKYQGPVVLVTDARCYSTTDIFSAGFQDHAIGPILGTSGATGAGGANVWTHEVLRHHLPDPNSPFPPLPGGVSFNVAIRRCTRVGPNAGRLVEDLGVAPDQIHRRTKRDLLDRDRDLFEQAGAMLKKQLNDGKRVGRLTADVKRQGGAVNGTVTTRNVDRFDVYVDRRPHASHDVVALAGSPAGAKVTTPLDLSRINPTATTLEVRGFNRNQLVVSSRVAL
jgi:hypothetical protein